MARLTVVAALGGGMMLASASTASAAMFEWDGSFSPGVNAGMIATDGAGRVLV
ncbi:MAG: hypothetical protein JHC87_04035, partial [Thermoleophilaceae bacterium]|nr:hypothetical protein [Thermoleophilaceae bacterium]